MQVDSKRTFQKNRISLSVSIFGWRCFDEQATVCIIFYEFSPLSNLPNDEHTKSMNIQMRGLEGTKLFECMQISLISQWWRKQACILLNCSSGPQSWINQLCTSPAKCTLGEKKGSLHARHGKLRPELAVSKRNNTDHHSCSVLPEPIRLCEKRLTGPSAPTESRNRKNCWLDGRLEIWCSFCQSFLF